MSRSLRTLYSRTPRILVVDDESFIREAIEMYFTTEGFKVKTAANGDEALRILTEGHIDVAILDILMPGMSGITLLKEMKKNYPGVEVVMASGNGTLESAVEAMRLGAYDYVSKPILNFEEDLLRVIRKALERSRLLATNRELARDLQDINFELKASNSDLRRRIAELEVVMEVGELLSEVSTRADLVHLIESTLRHQIGLEKAVLFTRSDSGLKAALAIGFDSGDARPTLPFPKEEITQISHLDMSDITGLDDVLDEMGDPPPYRGAITLIPLRCAGETQGLLLTFGKYTAEDETRLPLLKVFATQVAHPLALLEEEVTR